MRQTGTYEYIVELPSGKNLEVTRQKLTDPQQVPPAPIAPSSKGKEIRQ